MRMNLDANATYGLHPEVQRRLFEFIPHLQSDYLNPSSVHQGGQSARALIDSARNSVRELVGAAAEDDVIFTSGATEANNQAVVAPFLEFIANGLMDRSTYGLLTSCVEHESVAGAAARVAALGFPVTIVNPAKGRAWISANDVSSAMNGRVKVVSLIHGQNEIGSLLPISEITALIRDNAAQVLIHTDAVQTVGRIPVDMAALGVDAISISGHKLGGLAGVGALVVRRAARQLLPALLVGGAQEYRQRAGTENLIGIFSLGIAAEVARTDVQRGHRMRAARAVLRDALLQMIPGITFQGEGSSKLEQLPNTICLTLPPSCELRGDDLVVALDLEGVRISIGSACSSGRQEGSRTLKALGYPDSVVRSSVRLSLRGDEEQQALVAVARKIAAIIERSRNSYAAAGSINSQSLLASGSNALEITG